MVSDWVWLRACNTPVLTQGSRYSISHPKWLLHVPIMHIWHAVTPNSYNHREVIIGMHLRQFRATIRSRLCAQSIYSVSLQTFSFFSRHRRNAGTPRSVTGVKRLAAIYNGTKYITHSIKLSYCRKLFISYRLNEFSARSIVTVKNDVSDSNRAY